ncbi:YveK family protein [Vagococcus intermedius]|uniref:Capsular polysaccharide biosynthesis protein CpsC n=1 Tax=Vagococcus intermedius TaxID=2991418 RepID=A0AAF0I9U8_9ENTE|nr:Wzz/FepE/Etk N-terminal domain-containing protein [Vagococcus intermedius]WEG73787.1 Wzz/FepE/Etk N-terminal domain-containing protein [Vagococcus intermedius]WEG75872.1 Wzz/FepE/Etk N-terminal domain-containing protein [Vagococcus intermedius]
MEETISLQEIFNILKKRLVLILSSMFVGIGIAAILTFLIITPKYASNTQLIVKMPKTEEGSANAADVNATLMMINTYKDIIKSSVVVEKAHERLVEKNQFTGEANQIQSMLTVSQEQNSQMFTIKAIGTSPKEAQAVAGTVAEVFQEKAKEIIDVDKISIIAKASLNEKPVSPNNKLNLIIGAILGIVVGLGFSLLAELLDKTVKDDSFIRDTLGFPILGSVPQMSEKDLTQAMGSQGVVQNIDESSMTTNSRRSRSAER